MVNMNIYESMDKMKCMATNGFWQKGLMTSEEAKIRNIFVLAHNVSEEHFPNLEGTGIQEFSMLMLGI
jgi:hypothetical protein